MEKILIIIPAYNEEKSLESVVDNIILNYPQYDYLVVNDGSTDNTKRICNYKNYNVINLPINLGIGGAVQAGYLYALENDYDIAVQIDGDGQHDVQYVKDAVQLIVSGENDIVIGSRFIRNEGFQTSATRRLGIRILSAIVWICTGQHIKDVTSGFRAVNKRFIKIYSEDYSRDYPEPEAILTALMHEGKIREMPVLMKARENGKSTINFGKSFYYMCKVSLAIVIRRISYGGRRG